MRGCGSDVKMDQTKVLNFDTPLGMRTSATARPSGTLWTASEAEMKTPRWDPLAPQKETPIPRPS